MRLLGRYAFKAVKSKNSHGITESRRRMLDKSNTVEAEPKASQCRRRVLYQRRERACAWSEGKMWKEPKRVSQRKEPGASERAGSFEKGRPPWSLFLV